MVLVMKFFTQIVILTKIKKKWLVALLKSGLLGMIYIQKCNSTSFDKCK